MTSPCAAPRARTAALGRDDLAGKTGTTRTSATPGSTASTASSWPPCGWASTTRRSLGEGEEGASTARADLDALHARGAARRAVGHAGAAGRVDRPEGLAATPARWPIRWIRMRSMRRSCWSISRGCRRRGKVVWRLVQVRLVRPRAPGAARSRRCFGSEPEFTPIRIGTSGALAFARDDLGDLVGAADVAGVEADAVRRRRRSPSARACR